MTSADPSGEDEALRRRQRRLEEEDLARLQKKGGKGVIVALAVVALLAGGAAGGYFIWKRMQTGDKYASKAYGAAWGCMVGEPLETGEPLERRQRSIAAALADKQGDYPKRCDPLVQKFYESLGSDPKVDALREIMELDVKCSEKCSADLFG